MKIRTQTHNNDAPASPLSLHDWARGFQRPVVDAVQTGRLAEARSLHSRAIRSIDSVQLGEEEREAAGFLLELLDYNIRFMEVQSSWTVESYKAALFRLSRPAHTPAGREARLAALIKLRTIADKDQFEPLTRQQIEAYIAEAGGHPRDPQIWHDLAGWAYDHQDLAILEKAFAAHSTSPSPIMGFAKWQRINLMYQLLAGKAQRRDVEETIRTLSILPQLIDFMKNLWPPCVAAGLVDAELESLLEQRRSYIEATKPPPTPLARTRTLRTPQM